MLLCPNITPRRNVAVQAAAKAKPTQTQTFVSAPTSAAAPSPVDIHPWTAPAVIGGSMALLSYILMRQLVKNTLTGPAVNRFPRSADIVTASKFITSASEVTFRSSQVDVYASQPDSVSTVPARVLDRTDLGELVSLSLALDDGSQVSVTLTAEEDRAVWGFFDEVGYIFGGQKKVYIRVKPLDFEPVL